MVAARIVSLIPSATEIVAALDCTDRLVGRSHECDVPTAVATLPICSEPRIDVNGTSREIDDRVKAALQDALSVYRVHTDVLQQLQPSVILTQAQCDVCAVNLSDVQESVCELTGLRSGGRLGSRRCSSRMCGTTSAAWHRRSTFPQKETRSLPT